MLIQSATSTILSIDDTTGHEETFSEPPAQILAKPDAPDFSYEKADIDESRGKHGHQTKHRQGSGSSRGARLISAEGSGDSHHWHRRAMY